MINTDQTVENPGEIVAFQGEQCIGTGPLPALLATIKAASEQTPSKSILIFDRLTGKQIDFDFHGPLELIQQSLATATPATPEPRGPGRPKLGVVAREITLLPRHWEWLGAQSGGASVALRKLVEDARRGDGAKERARKAQEAAYRFMSAMAGDRPGFEEAARSLFAGDRAGFDGRVRNWPADIRDHATRLAAGAFSGQGG